MCVLKYLILIISHDVLTSNNKLAMFHQSLANKLLPRDVRKDQLTIAKKYCKEAIRITLKVNGPGHETTLDCEQRLSVIMELLN